MTVSSGIEQVLSAGTYVRIETVEGLFEDEVVEQLINCWTVLVQLSDNWRVHIKLSDGSTVCVQLSNG